MSTQTGRNGDVKRVGNDLPENKVGTMSRFTPGPGAYHATDGFDHISRAMQSAKTLQQFGLDQFGIQLIKPHNAFASKVRRFDEKE